MSADLAMRLRAQQRNLHVVTPPDAMMLTDEPDDVSRENTRLKREIEELRRRDVRVEATFIRENKAITDLSVARVQISPPSDADYHRTLLAARASLIAYLSTMAHVAVRIHDVTIQSTTMTPVRAIFEPAVERDIVELSEGIDGLQGQERITETYFRQYAAYLRAFYSYAVYRSRSYQIELRIMNTGNTVAEQAVVEVLAPTGCHLRKSMQLPPRPSPPKQPMFTSVGIIALIGSTGLEVHPYIDLPREDVLPHERRARQEQQHWNGPDVDPREPTRAVYKIKRLLHNVPLDIASFVLMPPEDWDGSPLVLNCRCHAEGQRDATLSTLTVSVGNTAYRDAWFVQMD